MLKKKIGNKYTTVNMFYFVTKSDSSIIYFSQYTTIINTIIRTA